MTAKTKWGGATGSPLEQELAFQLRAAKLPTPEREFRFHSTRRWRFDFCWIDRKLAVEVEGGVWSRGRHVRPAGFERDAEKYAAAARDGWVVMRVTGRMIKSGEALGWITEMLEEK